MLETPHALVGAAIVTNIPNPVVSLPLAFLSHFVFDMVPHWNPHLNTEIKKYGHITRKTTFIIAADVVVAFASSLFVANQFASSETHAFYIMLGALAGILPDVVEAPYFFLKWHNKFLKMLIKFQKSIQVDTDIIPGISTQIATIIASLWWMAS